MKPGRLLFLFLLLLGLPLRALDLEIVSPAAGDTIQAAMIDSNYVIGRVFPPQAGVTINGERLRVYSNGAFLAFLPIHAGQFSYDCLVTLGADTLAVKHQLYYVRSKFEITPDSTVIDSTLMWPSLDLLLQPGDRIDLGFRGTPNNRAWCQIEGVKEAIPLRAGQKRYPMYWGEAVFGSGNSGHELTDSTYYQGSYIIQSRDSCDEAAIHFYLATAAGDTISRTAGGRLSILKTGVPQMAETLTDLTVLRTGPHKSYYFFLPKGVPLRLTGKYGSSWRVQLAPEHDAWVETNKLKMLPQGTVCPRPYIRLVRTQSQKKYLRVRAYTGAKLPFRIEQRTRPQELWVYFYGLNADTDWVRHEHADELIREIRWQQESNDVYVLRIELNVTQQWGYDAGYDEQGNFILDIKRPPAISRRKRKALQNITVLIDPGHDPDTGAIGPTGLEEREANLLLATVLADKLRKKGAIVQVNRGWGDGLPLAERAQAAMASSADILLSLHHNGLPDGVNPAKNRGTSTYYYHPQSYELARLIQKELLKELNLNDFGLYWDNLAMCRPSQMPAVLIEPAFIIHPLEEMLISSREYKERCAEAIIRALVTFVYTGGNK